MFSDFTREKNFFSRKWWGAGANLPPPLSLSLRPCYHKSKIRTGESKIWKNNKNTEAQPKLSGFYEKVYLYTTLV